LAQEARTLLPRAPDPPPVRGPGLWWARSGRMTSLFSGLWGSKSSGEKTKETKKGKEKQKQQKEKKDETATGMSLLSGFFAAEAEEETSSEYEEDVPVSSRPRPRSQITDVDSDDSGERRHHHHHHEHRNRPACPSCGNVYLDDATFCRKCGQPRPDPNCPYCGNLYADDAEFCRKCGKPRPGTANSPEVLAKQEEQQKRLEEYYRVTQEWQMASAERDRLAAELPAVAHQLEMAEHALEWLQWRDGLGDAELAPWSVEEKSWVEACGGKLLLRMPVSMSAGHQPHQTNPEKAHHVALFPEVYDEKPRIRITIGGANHLRPDPVNPLLKPNAYCVCEIPGKLDSRLRTPVINDTCNPEWNFSTRVKHYAVGNTLSFHVYGTKHVTQKVYGKVGAHLWVTIFSAKGLRAADWHFSGNSSDPYCICEIPGKSTSKVQTKVIDANLEPVWNEKFEIKGFKAGDDLEFKVMDKDVWPKSDDPLGNVKLKSESFYPHGFNGELQLEDSEGTGTPTLRVQVVVMATNPYGASPTRGWQTSQGGQQSWAVGAGSEPGHPHEAQQASMQPGEKVRLQNLHGAPQYNGMDATLVQYDQASGAWAVNIDGNQFAVRPENVAPLAVHPQQAQQDEFLGSAELPSRRFYPSGFEGLLDLKQPGSQTTVGVNATLRVAVHVQGGGGRNPTHFIQN